MNTKIKDKIFLSETPPDLSGFPGYVEYMWYDGPMMFSLGNATRRYFFHAIEENEISEANRCIPYLVTPMTNKRERDIIEDKLTLRQSVLHSGGNVFVTNDYGRTFEPVDLTEEFIERHVCDPGVRFSYNHPAWRKHLEKRRQKRKARELRARRNPFKAKVAVAVST